VRAYVVGSRGRKSATGPQLRARLDLRDSWFYIRRVSTRTGGATARTSSGERHLTAIYGRVDGTGDRFVDLQRADRGRWVTVEKVPLQLRGRGGSYRFHVGKAGRYRILAGWAPGPAVNAK